MLNITVKSFLNCRKYVQPASVCKGNFSGVQLVDIGAKENKSLFILQNFTLQNIGLWSVSGHSLYVLLVICVKSARSWSHNAILIENLIIDNNVGFVNNAFQVVLQYVSSKIREISR